MKKKFIYFLILVFVVGGALLLSNNMSASSIATDLIESEDNVSFWTALFCEAFVSIHMSVFVLFPLAGIINRNKKMPIFIILFSLRLLILVIGDIINPMVMMMIDFMAVFFGAFILIPVAMFFKKVVYGKEMGYHEYVEVDEAEIHNIGFSNKDLLKRVLLEQYFDIKHAISDFDYKKLVELCSKERYLLYKNEMKLLEQVGEKKIFDGFEIVDSKICDAYKSNDGIYVNIIMKINYLEYTIDAYNKVTYGSNTDKKNLMMELVFYKSLKHAHIDECPNCASPITEGNMEFCSYCGTELNFQIGEFVLNEEIIVG